MYRGGGRHKYRVKNEELRIFEKIISLENLFSAWNEFRRGKEKKIDVARFNVDLEDNIFALHNELKSGNYQHSHYTSFYVKDPKLRHIHKAKVSDRVLHQAIARIIEPIFEEGFIFDSYSSRKNKGTHKAVQRFKKFAWKLSQNDTKTVWVLKCDIKKFFDSVDHNILLAFIKKKISDEKAIGLIENIIRSFAARAGKGIPLGNLTSQLFSNIYLNELDRFVKIKLREKYYIRYADDFVVLGRDRSCLAGLIPKIRDFLKIKLDLNLHPQKIILKKWHQGVDFLGYVSFPHHTILRTKTKKRAIRKIKDKCRELSKGVIVEKSFKQSLQSYFGILKHCYGHKIKKRIQIIVSIENRKL